MQILNDFCTDFGRVLVVFNHMLDPFMAILFQNMPSKIRSLVEAVFSSILLSQGKPQTLQNHCFDYRDVYFRVSAFSIFVSPLDLKNIKT